MKHIYQFRNGDYHKHGELASYCSEWAACWAKIARAIAGNPANLLLDRIDTTFTVLASPITSWGFSACVNVRGCAADLDAWKAEAKAKITAIPAFSSLSAVDVP